MWFSRNPSKQDRIRAATPSGPTASDKFRREESGVQTTHISDSELTVVRKNTQDQQEVTWFTAEFKGAPQTMHIANNLQSYYEGTLCKIGLLADNSRDLIEI